MDVGVTYCIVWVCLCVHYGCGGDQQSANRMAIKGRVSGLPGVCSSRPILPSGCA